jgi:hypothetical protein
MAAAATAVIMRWPEAWPRLPLAGWLDTYKTLHMWTQIVGKVRMTLSPHVNHWWEVPLYVCARGLTTTPIPYDGGVFEIRFDFVDHHLDILTSHGKTRVVRLYPRSVADFYVELMADLRSLGIPAQIRTKPCELADPIPFDADEIHHSYDGDAVQRFWHILVSVDSVFKEFRARFLGKVSPVQFFWGSFDLAVTRFSGRRAPARPGADAMTREAYSHEVISCGFWPGAERVSEAAFYAYAAPEPAGFRDSAVHPDAAYNASLGEFLLPYDAVGRLGSPRASLLEFCQSTYAAGARLGHWDRDNLELRG